MIDTWFLNMFAYWYITDVLDFINNNRPNTRPKQRNIPIKGDRQDYPVCIKISSYFEQF
jgi:hypothetical protein